MGSDLINRAEALRVVEESATRDRAIGRLYELPSAQPERKTGRWKSYGSDAMQSACSKQGTDKYCGVGCVVGDPEHCYPLYFHPDKQLPSAGAERKTGRWTKDNACDRCGFKPWYEGNINTLSYCPNCGAKMEVDKQ